MFAKIIVVLALIAILGCLGSALYSLIRHKDHPERMAKALTTRIALSFALFLFLMLAFATGLIQPHGFNALPQKPSSGIGQ